MSTWTSPQNMCSFDAELNFAICNVFVGHHIPQGSAWEHPLNEVLSIVGRALSANDLIVFVRRHSRTCAKLRPL